MATAKEKLIASAQKLVEKGAFEKAIKEYLRVVQEDNADVRIWLKIGDLYAKIGKKTEATDTYQRVAQFYSDQGFYLKSVAVYKQILKLEPRLVDVNMRLAELYKQLGLISDAISQYEQVAAFFHKDGKVKEALGAMKQIVDLDPETVAARIKLAEMYSREQLPREAVEEFTHAANQLHEQGRLDEYMKVAERLLFHSPDNKPVTRELARLYIEKSDPRRALPKLQVLFKADPRDLDVLRLLARAFEGLEQRPKAVSVYKELARILQDTGDARAATEVFRQILSIQPDDAEAAAAVRGAPPSPSTSKGSALPPPGKRPAATPPPLVSSGPARSHATGAERALDSGGHRTINAGGSGEHVRPTTGAHEVPAPDAPADVLAEEIAKILSETDVYIKYNLHQKAIDHLQRVFERQPRHVAAREKLKALYITIGRKEDAISELWALSESAEQGRARRYVREIYELDPSNARAANVLGEVVRSASPVASAEPDVEDDYGVSMPSDFGLPTSAPRREAVVADAGLGDIEITDDSEGVSLDEESLSESDFEEEPDDDIPVVLDTGSDSSARAVSASDEDDEGRFTIDDVEAGSLPVATGYETASADAETHFGAGPRGVAAAPVVDDELSFADLDGVEERTGVMSADEMSSFDDPAPQRTDFRPGTTAVSQMSPLEPEPSDTGARRSAPIEPLRTAPVESLRSESSLEDDLDESDFFMQQSLFEEARTMLGSLLERYPEHPLVEAKLRELEGLEGQVAADVPSHVQQVVGTNTAEIVLPPGDLMEPMRPMGSIRALSAQLPTGVPGDEHASDAMADAAAPVGRGVEVTRRGVVERGVPAEDFETHYDLGIAYKEMGLIDDAIGEFRQVMRDPKREVQCQLMIGLCYLEKDMFTEAINQFKKGLYVEDITDPEALSLYYELGQAYEKIGDPREALYYYDKVQKREPQFRDLARRLRALRGEESVVTAAPVGRTDDVDDMFDSLLDESN